MSLGEGARRGFGVIYVALPPEEWGGGRCGVIEFVSVEAGTLGGAGPSVLPERSVGSDSSRPLGWMLRHLEGVNLWYVQKIAAAGARRQF